MKIPYNSIAHQLGVQSHIAHELTNAILLGSVIQCNASKNHNTEPFCGIVSHADSIDTLRNTSNSDKVNIKSYINNNGCAIVVFGWGFAVMIGVYVAGQFNGAHLNPVVTFAFAINGSFPWADVVPYIIAQVLSAFVGAAIVALHYYPHFKATPKEEVNTLRIFSTGPAIENTLFNLISEIVATFAFVFSLSVISANEFAQGLNPLIVGFLVVAIGMSFGSKTGYAINPARDLGPRLAYFLHPIPNKSDANLGYAWIPIVGPIIGSVLAVLLYGAIF